MSTALSVYYAFAASSTISTANKLYTGTGGSPTTAQNLTTINGSTGFGEIPAQGSASAWAGLGSIGAPTGKGFFLDATTLDGQDLISGNYSGIIRFNTQAAGTVTTDIYVRVHRYHPGTTTYTQIVSMVLTGQSITNTITSFSLPSTSVGSNTSFATGDKLYVDCWWNITTNTSSTGQQIKHNRQSTDTTTFVGDTQAVVVTPGFQVTSGSTQVTKSLSSRFRLSVQVLKDLSSRVRLSAVHTQDLSTRLRLNVLSLKDLSSRVRINATKQRDLSLRFLLNVLRQKDFSTRLRLSLGNIRDLSTRLRLSAVTLRDLSTRLRLSVTLLHDLSTRLRLSLGTVHDLSTRLRLSAVSQRNLFFRLLLSVLRQKDLPTRFLLATGRQQNITFRFFLLTVVVPSPQSPFIGSSYVGTGGMLPISTPTSSYIINGLVLDTPSTCTAPMASNSVTVPTGSVFSLSFINPSALTQSLLTTWSSATMTFALYTGEMVTGLVQFQVNASSSVWQVLCTTLAPIQVKRWKVQSQFP